jgi:Tfp pilus assembly protein PilF
MSVGFRLAPVTHRAALFSGALVLSLLTGCQSMAPPPALPATESIVLLYARPAERALINGLRAYEDGAFERAEQSFRTAVLQNLRDRRDLAVAHKYLAFIACAFNRISECEQQFRNAFGADPDFALTDAEIGHPIWGPVYRRVETVLRG